jgi:hypothetical protein
MRSSPATLPTRESFNQVVEGRPIFQAFIPLDKSSKGGFFVSSVNSNGRTSSTAIMSATTQAVRYLALDRGGNLLCDAARFFTPGLHDSFIISQRLRCLAGVDGMVLVAGDPDSGLFGVGITAQDDGAFVTHPVIPIATQASFSQ